MEERTPMRMLSADELEIEEVLDQHYELLKELGDCQAALGDYVAAEDYYIRAQALAPGETGPKVGLGTVALQQDRLEAAEQAFEAARRIEPFCAEAHAGLAMVCQRRGDFSMAFDLYLKCLELDTDNLVALLGLFQASCQMGSFSKVIYYLEVYLDRHPGDSSVLFCLASLYAREGDFPRARRALLDVLALEPHKKEAIELLGQVEECLDRDVPAGTAIA